MQFTPPSVTVPKAVLLWCVLGLLVTGCSVKKIALNQVGNALAGSGTVISSENDPELVKDAIPFVLVLIETILAENPNHDRLRTAAAAYYTQYAYAFLQSEADYLDLKDWNRAEHLRKRAKNLFLRARDHGLYRLGRGKSDWPERLARSPRTAMEGFDNSAIETLYWTAAAWASAINLGKDDPFLVAELPQMEALIDRAYQLDPDWQNGAIHTFMIAYEINRSATAGDPERIARNRFDSALRAGEGRHLAPYVSLAEAVSVPTQNKTEFQSLLNRAIAADVDRHPETRLINLLTQQRAQWLLSRTDELFLPDLSFEPDE